MDHSKEAQVRAEANFKKKQQQALDNEKAKAEYDALGRATRLKTERLKALRLAKEEAEKEPEVVKKPSRKPLRKSKSES